tara:strand:+ start:203 stop:853 length:651 start_codon:yes stop_codon:yes gene_type:complete
MSIRDNILKIKEEIGDEAKLVAVSKTRSTKEINDAYNSGQKIFGENRVQEIVEKQKLLPDDIEWHMIGHLQKNKVKYISSFISLIHSLDRISLAKEIDKYAKKSNRKIDCLIQLKISSEETKFGLDINHLENFYSEVKEYNNINLVGLMGMASFTQEKEKIIDEFNKIKELYDKMKLKNSNLKILSTGMSDDYKLALKNGSNMIRLGSKIFGKRDY